MFLLVILGNVSVIFFYNQPLKIINVKNVYQVIAKQKITKWVHKLNR
jgi:hypothetical protein